MGQSGPHINGHLCRGDSEEYGEKFTFTSKKLKYKLICHIPA